MKAYTAKMPEMPEAATANISHTAIRRRTPSSRATVPPRRSSVRGTQANSAPVASTPIPATSHYMARQPAVCAM